MKFVINVSNKNFNIPNDVYFNFWRPKYSNDIKKFIYFSTDLINIFNYTKPIAVITTVGSSSSTEAAPLLVFSLLQQSIPQELSASGRLGALTGLAGWLCCVRGFVASGRKYLWSSWGCWGEFPTAERDQSVS